ncbi:MAG: LL-diaminopimelate aminotransferase [Vampirovibrionia bacterium]
MNKTKERVLNIPVSQRISKLPMYVFAELDVLKAEARAQGLNVIDLGIGSPDLPTPEPIIEAAQKAVADPSNHGYPNFKGKPEFRKAVSEWMMERYNVEMDPETEIQALIGSKEGLAHLSMAYTDVGDINIVPDPYYPVHSRGTWVAGGDVYHIPLKAENKFLPDLKSIPEDIAKKAKMFFINYPNNPTSAIAPIEFYQEIVDYCLKYNILLVSDMAYGELGYDGYRPPSIFNVPEARNCAIEFHSCSKTFCMAGFRVGFAVGNKDIIKSLFSIKTNCDYGLASFLQDATIAAFKMDKKYLNNIVSTYQRRRDIVIDGFNSMGWNLEKPKATMYTWIDVPEGYDSKSWIKKVLFETGVCLTPGIAFGEHSDKYFRISLVQKDETLQEVIRRLKENNISFK